MPENIPARQARQQRAYSRKKAAGLVTVRDWCYPEDRAEIHELCATLRRYREDEGWQKLEEAK